MSGDRPGKPPKQPLKALKGDKRLGRLALSWGGRTPRGRVSSILSNAHARTRTHTHTHLHMYIYTITYTHIHMYKYTIPNTHTSLQVSDSAGGNAAQDVRISMDVFGGAHVFVDLSYNISAVRCQQEQQCSTHACTHVQTRA